MESLVTETVWLRRLARALVKDDALADDLVQDTFVTAAEKAPTDGRPLRPWLFRVLVNRVRMTARSSGRRSARESRLGELAAPSVGPDELVAQVETQRMLAGLVLALPEAQRDVLLLHYYEGLSSAEIGKRLGIPAGTARWRLKQALDELRARLDQRQPNRAWIVAVGQLAEGGRSAAPAALPALFLVAIALVIVVAIVVRIDDVATRSVRPGRAREVASMPAKRSPTIAIARPMVTRIADQEYAVLRIEGQVIDDAGHAVAGAQVQLDVECSYAAQKQSDVVTGADGAFVFLVEPGCRYWFSALAGPLRGRAAVMAEPTGPVILTLREEPPQALRFVDADTEQAIPGVTVRLEDGTELAADPQGRVRFVPTARRVTIAARGYIGDHLQLHHVWSGEQLVTTRDPDSGDWQGSTEKATPGRPEEVVIPLVRGTRHVEGRVVDARGKPVEGCEVELVALHGKGREGVVVTGADGRFTAWLTDADTLVATHRPQWRPDPIAKSDERELAPTETFVELALSRLVGHDVMVTVLDELGRPAVHAEVSALRGTFRTGYTNERGELTIRALDSETPAIARHGGLASPVTLIDDAPVTLRLAPSGLAGVVIDSRGEPMPDVWVRIARSKLTDEVGGRQMTTDQYGRFELDVPPGRYVLSASREGVFDSTERETAVQAAAHDVRVPID